MKRITVFLFTGLFAFPSFTNPLGFALPRLPAGALEEAAKILAAKKRDNPRRTMGYLIGILRNKVHND